MPHEVITGGSTTLAADVARWVEREWQAGAALFVLEGLMGSGKTTLTQQIVLCSPNIQLIELDDFLEPGHPTWAESLNARAVALTIRASIKTRQPVLVEGAIVSPVVRAQFAGVAMKRIYLKRMQFPGFWADEWQLTEFAKRQMVRRSVRDYHNLEQPWTTADLVVERLVDEATGE